MASIVSSLHPFVLFVAFVVIPEQRVSRQRCEATVTEGITTKSTKIYRRVTEGIMTYQALNFEEKLSLFDERWAPKVIAEMNDYQFKVAKLKGDFLWHDHKDTDETFIVLEGNLRIDFRDGHVELSAGEMFVVPKGVEHKPYAEEEAKVLLIEPRGVKNTGDEDGERTAENDVWI